MLERITNCIGSLYCKIEKMKCVGRDTEKEELLMRKLLIAKWLVCDCNECGEIACFIEQNCNC